MRIKGQIIAQLVILLLVICGCEEVTVEPIAIVGSYTIAFNLDESSDVVIDIENRFDTIVNSYDLGNLPGGNHHMTWDRLDKNGEDLLPGSYFIVLSINGEKHTHGVYHLEHDNS